MSGGKMPVMISRCTVSRLSPLHRLARLGERFDIRHLHVRNREEPRAVAVDPDVTVTDPQSRGYGLPELGRGEMPKLSPMVQPQAKARLDLRPVAVWQGAELDSLITDPAVGTKKLLAL